MILGEYPCCGASLAIGMPDKTPTAYPEDCPECGEKIWHYCSRVLSTSYTEEDFLKEYSVDPANKSIKKRKQNDRPK